MKHLIIGNMTGNSMDAIDLVLTEFDKNKMKDICTYSKPYNKEMQENMELLRKLVANKTANQIEKISQFNPIHNAYISEIADCINDMLEQNNIDKSQISAIGFHGKTLDHYPPSYAKINGGNPYTLQIGSGQMLADITQIPVVYDFRSDPLMAGLEGAPLVAFHNAHIATHEGDGCYYNGGNTSNFAWVVGGNVKLSSDAGPFNEYVDNFIRDNTNDCYDIDGKYGLKGQLNKELLQKLFDLGRVFYETPSPKSGDPQYYFKNNVFMMIRKDYPFRSNDKTFCDIVHTFEYFSAYIAFHALANINSNIELPNTYILFGGGWKNPVSYQAFTDLIQGDGYILPEHKRIFDLYYKRFKTKPYVRYSEFGQYMEARLFADLAYHKLENKYWEFPKADADNQKIVCGIIAKPDNKRKKYLDMCSRATKGWQDLH